MVLYFQNYTIHYWLDNGLEKEKIILGMPFYGQSFKLANENENGLNAKAFGGASGGEFTKSEGFLSYYEVILDEDAFYHYFTKDDFGTMKQMLLI